VNDRQASIATGRAVAAKIAVLQGGQPLKGTVFGAAFTSGGRPSPE
jgi:hypothetical protein